MMLRPPVPLRAEVDLRAARPSQDLVRDLASSPARHGHRRSVGRARCARAIPRLTRPIARPSSVEIEDQAVKVLGTEDVPASSNSQDTDRLLQTQIDILHSRALAERVADGLNLTSNDRFLQAQGVKPKPAIKREQVIRGASR